MRVLVLLTLLALADTASAQTRTPGEIPKPGTFEGSVEVERRRQETATKPPESQFPKVEAPSAAASAANAASVREAQSATLASYRAYLTRPALAPERNPLLGRWSWQNVTPSRDPINGLVESILGVGAVNAVGCSVLFGDGVVEFRPDGVVTIQGNTESKAPGPWVYRGSATQVAAIKTADVDRGETGYLLEFDFVSPDRIRSQGGACEMTRVGAISAPRAASAAPAAGARPSAPPVKSGATYVCAAEKVYVDSCLRDRDKPGFRPRSDNENFCNVYYPDRPKTRAGGLASESELERDLAVKLQSCKVQP